MLLLQASGKTTMLKKEFYVNYLEAAANNLNKQEEVDSEVKLTFCFVAIHLLRSHNFYNMCIKLRQGESTLPEKEVQQLVLQYTLQKILKLENLF